MVGYYLFGLRIRGCVAGAVSPGLIRFWTNRQTSIQTGEQTDIRADKLMMTLSNNCRFIKMLTVFKEDT